MITCLLGLFCSVLHTRVMRSLPMVSSPENELHFMWVLMSAEEAPTSGGTASTFINQAGAEYLGKITLCCTGVVSVSDVWLPVLAGSR